MNLFQAFAYFAREALVSLIRSWKVSLLAILTISISLFLAGVFLLASSNLRQLIDRWRGESKVVIYLDHDAGAEALDRLKEEVASAPWIATVETVSAAEARRRFRASFPSLGDLLEGWGDDPLPPSIEARLKWRALELGVEFESWIQELSGHPAVAMVDDDRDWLDQLQAVVLAIEALGLVLGGILIVTAIFTISNVIRLTAYLYRDEIAVMRLVGATEFFIRGPFYVEGLLQGLAGGAVATGGLYGVHTLLIRRQGEGLLSSVLGTRFLTPAQILVLISLGGLAGLIGALSSLRKESLGPAPEAEPDSVSPS